MKKLIITIGALLVSGLMTASHLLAASGELTLPRDPMPRLTGDVLVLSQQRGMRIYMDNCFGCHALGFQRYQRTAEDLKIPEEVMLQNFVASDGKIGDLMTNNMNTKAAANWFGTAPPDLSVIARSRGTEWLYNYLRGFYQDDSRPYGVNNSVFKDVGMPHVFEFMQGMQVKTEKVLAFEAKIANAKGKIAAAKKEQEDGDANDASSELDDLISENEEIIHQSEQQLIELADKKEYFELVKAGQLTPEEFDNAMLDLVNFLDYVGEPIKQKRKTLGVWVLIFTLIFGIFAYLLKKEYWKDIH